jgi:hypothetical protein
MLSCALNSIHSTRTKTVIYVPPTLPLNPPETSYNLRS